MTGDNIIIGKNISGNSEHYCTKHNVVLLESAVKECHCRHCDFRVVREKEKA